MRVGLWARWMAMHGVPRAYLAVRARRGDSLARMLRADVSGDDRYSLMEEIRARGPLVRTPFAWASVDHGVCREVLRDKRFGVTVPTEMELPRLLRAVISKTDPDVPNPVEPPAMVIVNPPDHTRYRQLVAQSFTPRAIDTLGTRVAEVTMDLIERIAATPHPDLIADFAMQLPVAIIAEILGLAADSYPRMLEWGSSGAPLLDVGIDWKTYRKAIHGLRDADDYLADHFQKLRAGQPGDNPFSLLLQHPEQLARLCGNPGLWPAAIEEILRLASPVQMTARTPGCDVEVAGAHIAAGEMVALFLGGANRDLYVFTEPARFDIARANARDSSGVCIRHTRLPRCRAGPNRGCHRAARTLRDLSRYPPHRTPATAGAGQPARIRTAARPTRRQENNFRRTARVKQQLTVPGN